MDAQGIDVEALSINPYWYAADRDVAAELIRVQNETLAEICAAQPDRFVAFASVALQHPDLAAEQLEQGVKRYGLRGAGLGGSVDGPRAERPEVSPVLGQGRAARRPGLHPPAGHGRAGADGPARGQRAPHQHHRQPARDDDRAVAPHLRGHPRPLPRPQDLRRPRRRLSALLRRPLERGADDVPPSHDRDAQEAADGVPAPALLRLDRLHARRRCVTWRSRRDRATARALLGIKS